MFQRKISKYKKRWTQEETLSLLKHFKARREEFKLARKRRLAYSRCLEDMLAEGLDPNTNVTHLEVKMQTLWRSYKAAKAANQEAKTYVPHEPPFFKEMEEIFGAHKKNESFSFNAENFVFTVSEVSEARKQDMSASSFSLAEVFPSTTETSFTDHSIPEEVIIKSEDISESFCKVDSISEEVTTKPEDLPNTSSIAGPNPEARISKSNARDESALGDSSSSSSSSESNKPKRSKSKMSRSEYYKIRLQQFEREQKAIAERWKQHLEAKQEWRRKKLELLEKLLKK